VDVAAIDIKATARPVTFGGGVVVLLALAIFINYVDRGNLATAAPLMKDELHLSASRIGLLLSAFFWTYVPAQILAGWLSEKINPYRTYALGLGLWSVSTALTGLAGGFSMLILLRLLLGLGESVAFPCSSKLIAQHLPQHRLGVANGMIALGLSLGPAFGTFAGGLLMARLGWRPVFLLFGLVSLLWLWPWLAVTRHLSRADDGPKVDAAPPFSQILARREAWGAGLGHFCNNYAFYFVISWLPLYLVKTRGFTVSQMAEVGGLIYLVYAASSILTGWPATCSPRPPCWAACWETPRWRSPASSWRASHSASTAPASIQSARRSPGRAARASGSGSRTASATWLASSHRSSPGPSSTGRANSPGRSRWPVGWR
jgi:MFS family permease